MVSFALRFVSSHPQDETNRGFPTGDNLNRPENRQETAKEPARLAGPGRAG
jgi:hypothetical protein